MFCIVEYNIYKDQSIGKKINLPPAIKRQVQIKQRRWNRFLETRDPVKYRLYRKQTDYVKKLIKKTRKDELEMMAKKMKGNLKRFWSYVNSKTKTRHTVPNLKSKTTGRDCTTDIDKGNALSASFRLCLSKNAPTICLK